MLEEPLALAMALYKYELLQAARRRQAENGQGHISSARVLARRLDVGRAFSARVSGTR